MAVLIGLYLLPTDVFRFVAAFTRERHERLPSLLPAVSYLPAGVLGLRDPLRTIAALSPIVGIIWLVSGILTLYAALSTENLPRRGFVMGMAVAAVVAGIIVLALPAGSARALTRLLGLWLVLLGLAEGVVALGRRSALRGAPRPGCTVSPGPTATAPAARSPVPGDATRRVRDQFWNRNAVEAVRWRNTS